MEAKPIPCNDLGHIQLQRMLCSFLLFTFCLVPAGTMLDRQTFLTTQILLSKSLAWQMTQITALPNFSSKKCKRHAFTCPVNLFI